MAYSNDKNTIIQVDLNNELKNQLDTLARNYKSKIIKIEKTVTLSKDSDSVSFGITEYNPADDVLMVYRNSVYMSKDTDYTLGGDGLTIFHINSPEKKWNKDTEFNFVVLKNVERDLPSSDGSLLQNGSVTDEKLTESIKISPALTDKD